MTHWHFYLPDDDRSSGWSNHTYVLQFVAAGDGDTPAEAWLDACNKSASDLGVPVDFIREGCVLTAIQSHHEVKFTDPVDDGSQGT